MSKINLGELKPTTHERYTVELPLQRRWKNVCEEYLVSFCDKHEINPKTARWVGDEVGGVADLGDYFVDLLTIIYDVDNHIEKDKFFNWYNKQLEYADLNMKYLNYQSFCKGAPQPKTDEELEAIRKAKKAVEDAQRELNELINDNKLY